MLYKFSHLKKMMKALRSLDDITARHIQSPHEEPVKVFTMVALEMGLRRIKGKVGWASKEPAFVKHLLRASAFAYKLCPLSACWP